MGNLKTKARAKALALYRQGETQKQIATQVGVTEKTVGIWRKQYGWDEQPAAPAETPVALALPVPADMPPWAVPLLTLLSAQQLQLQRLETLLARTLPPA